MYRYGRTDAHPFHVTLQINIIAEPIVISFEAKNAKASILVSNILGVIPLFLGNDCMSCLQGSINQEIDVVFSSCKVCLHAWKLAQPAPTFLGPVLDALTPCVAEHLQPAEHLLLRAHCSIAGPAGHLPATQPRQTQRHSALRTFHPPRAARRLSTSHTGSFPLKKRARVTLRRSCHHDSESDLSVSCGPGIRSGLSFSRNGQLVTTD